MSISRRMITMTAIILLVIVFRDMDLSTLAAVVVCWEVSAALSLERSNDSFCVFKLSSIFTAVHASV